MKFKFILSTALAATLAASSHAAITFSANNSGGGGRQVTSSLASGGTLLSSGGSLRIGYFVDSSSPVLNSGDWAAINALFIPLGEGRPNLGAVATPAAGNTPIPIPSGATAGRFLGSIGGVTGTNAASDPPASLNSLSQGVRLFLFVSNSPNGTTAPTQFALVSDSTAWRAPKDDPTIPGGATLTMAMNATNIDAPSDMFWGSIDTVGAANFLRLAPVGGIPEPSTGLLGLLAGLGLIGRRRR